MNDGQHEDPELLTRLEAGDREALSALFTQHRDRLWRMVRARIDARLERRVDPDDVLQEAWLAAVQRIDSFKEQPERSCYLWLRLIVGQTLIDLHRRHLAARMRDAAREVPLSVRTGPRVDSNSLSLQLSGSLTSPSQAAHRAELTIALRDALESMDGIDREVLVLRHLEELSNVEAAAVLGIQASAASNRYVRALKRLQGVLAARHGVAASDVNARKPE